MQIVDTHTHIGEDLGLGQAEKEAILSAPPMWLWFGE